MRRVRVLMLAFGPFLLWCCDEQPNGASSPERQTARAVEVSNIETTFGCVVQARSDARRDTLTEGGHAPGTIVDAGPIGKARLEIDDLRVLIHAGSSIRLDRRLAILQGEAVVEADEPTDVVAEGHAVSLGAGTKASLVANGDEVQIAVSRGSATVEENTAGPGQRLRLAGAHVEISAAPVLAMDTTWSAPRFGALERGLGKLVGKAPGQEAEHRLDLIHHSVRARIHGHVAYTEIEEHFENPTGRELEGVFRFPLPPGAQIGHLSLEVDGEWREGEFVENERARQIWDDVIDKATRPQPKFKDPALLRWKEGNTFELRIYPIGPRAIRKVRIGWTQALQPTADGYRYVYPLPSDAAGLVGARRFEFRAELHGGVATSLRGSGYPMHIQSGAPSVFVYSADDFRADGDLELNWRVPNAASVRTYTYADGEDEPGYALITFRPDLPVGAAAERRDFLVALDRSFSQTGAAFAQQKRLVSAMLGEMDRADRVAVVACNHTCEAVGQPGFVPVGESTALGALEDLQTTGASNPIEAFRVAADLFRRRGESGRSQHFVSFSDGLASTGAIDPDDLRDAVDRVLEGLVVRVSVVEHGGDLDTANTAALAAGANKGGEHRYSSGRVVRLDPEASDVEQALALLNEHYRALLVNAAIEAPDGVEIEPWRSTLASGEEVVIAARFGDAVKADLALSGIVGGEPFHQTIPVVLDRASSVAGNAFVPQSWARHRIDALQSGEHTRDEVVGLSVEHGVLSRYTSLLALESDAMMVEYGMSERERPTWDGETAPQSAPKETRSRTAAKAKGGGMKTHHKVAKDSIDSLLADDLSGFLESDSRPSPRRSRGIVTHNLGFRTHAVSDHVEWAERRLQGDPKNRTKRMQLIRALVAKGNIGAASEQTERWLAQAPRDPEAIVQRAQLAAAQGDVETFLDGMNSAADAAPRGEWLQTRLARLWKAEGNDALSCAYEVSASAVSGKSAADRDVLACPMATDVSAWFAQRPPRVPRSTASDLEIYRGGTLFELQMPKGRDFDLAVVEPDGRLLWWGSQRRGVRVEGVRGGSVERLHLGDVAPAHEVLVMARDGGGPAEVTVNVYWQGEKASRSLTIDRVAGVGTVTGQTSTRWETTGSAAPTSEPGLPQRLSRDDVRKTIRRYRSRLRQCSISQNEKSLTGTVKVKFHIRPSGRTRSVDVLSTEFRGTDVGTCFRLVVTAMVFPKTSARHDVPVTYPFTIR